MSAEESRCGGCVLRAEGVDAGVLQETAHNTFNGNIFTDARQSRPQAADAPDDELDFYASLRGLIVQVNDVLVGEAVHLGDDLGGKPLPAFSLHQNQLSMPVLRELGETKKLRKWTSAFPMARHLKKRTASLPIRLEAVRMLASV